MYSIFVKEVTRGGGYCIQLGWRPLWGHELHLYRALKGLRQNIHENIPGKRNPGRGNSKYKSPEAGSSADRGESSTDGARGVRDRGQEEGQKRHRPGGGRGAWYRPHFILFNSLL